MAWVRLAAAAHIVGDVGVALDDAKRAGVDDGEEQMRRAHEERAPAAGRAAAGADDAAEGQPDQDEAGGAEADAVQRVAEGEEEDCAARVQREVFGVGGGEAQQQRRQ